MMEKKFLNGLLLFCLLSYASGQFGSFRGFGGRNSFSTFGRPSTRNQDRTVDKSSDSDSGSVGQSRSRLFSVRGRARIGSQAASVPEVNSNKVEDEKAGVKTSSFFSTANRRKPSFTSSNSGDTTTATTTLTATTSTTTTASTSTVEPRSLLPKVPRRLSLLGGSGRFRQLNRLGANKSALGAGETSTKTFARTTTTTRTTSSTTTITTTTASATSTTTTSTTTTSITTTTTASTTSTTTTTTASPQTTTTVPTTSKVTVTSRIASSRSPSVVSPNQHLESKTQESDNLKPVSTSIKKKISGFSFLKKIRRLPDDKKEDSEPAPEVGRSKPAEKKQPGLLRIAKPTKSATASAKKKVRIVKLNEAKLERTNKKVNPISNDLPQLETVKKSAPTLTNIRQQDKKVSVKTTVEEENVPTVNEEADESIEFENVDDNDRSSQVLERLKLPRRVIKFPSKISQKKSDKGNTTPSSRKTLLQVQPTSSSTPKSLEDSNLNADNKEVPSKKGRRVRIGLFPKGDVSSNTETTTKTQQLEESRDSQEEAKGSEPADPRDATEKKKIPQFFNRQELKERLRSVVLNAINTQDSSSLEEKVAKLRSTIVAELPEHAKDQIQQSQQNFQEEAARLFALKSEEVLKNPPPAEKPKPREKVLKLPIKEKTKASNGLSNEHKILRDKITDKATKKVESAGLPEGGKRIAKGDVTVNQGGLGSTKKVDENNPQHAEIIPAADDFAKEEVGRNEVKTRRILSLFGKRPKESGKKVVSKPPIRIEVIPKTQSRSKPSRTQPSNTADNEDVEVMIDEVFNNIDHSDGTESRILSKYAGTLQRVRLLGNRIANSDDVASSEKTKSNEKPRVLEKSENTYDAHKLEAKKVNVQESVNNLRAMLTTKIKGDRVVLTPPKLEPIQVEHSREKTKFGSEHTDRLKTPPGAKLLFFGKEKLKADSHVPSFKAVTSVTVDDEAGSFSDTDQYEYVDVVPGTFSSTSNGDLTSSRDATQTLSQVRNKPYASIPQDYSLNHSSDDVNFELYDDPGYSNVVDLTRPDDYTLTSETVDSSSYVEEESVVPGSYVEEESLVPGSFSSSSRFTTVYNPYDPVPYQTVSSDGAFFQTASISDGDEKLVDYQYPDTRHTGPQPAGSSRVVQSQYTDGQQSAPYIQSENPRFSSTFRDEYLYDDLSYSPSQKDSTDIYRGQFSGLEKQTVGPANIQSAKIFREPLDLGFTDQRFVENHRQTSIFEEPFYGSEDVSQFNLPGTRESAKLEYANFDYDEQGNIILLNPAGFPIATLPPGSIIDASNPFPTDLTNVEITPVFISNSGPQGATRSRGPVHQQLASDHGRQLASDHGRQLASDHDRQLARHQLEIQRVLQQQRLAAVG